MKRVARFVGLAFMVCVTVQGCTAPAQTLQTSTDLTTLPAGTKIELAVTAPVRARTAKVGDALYAQVDFPVIAGKEIAIPAGTYVQGAIQSIVRPSRFKSRADIQVLITNIIFANGYAVPLPNLSIAQSPGVNLAHTSAVPAPLAPTLIALTINVSTSNDLLLDNGAQFDMTLAAPLSLDTKQLATAISLSRPVNLGQFKSATQCQPALGTPGSPGTPDTVIPGSPGTPDTTIPGGPGMQDTVTPGTPATPPTIIPGTPGSPGFPGRDCPAAPIVVSSVLVPYTALAAHIPHP